MTETSNISSKSPSPSPDMAPLSMNIRGPVIAGFVIIGLFFGVFGGWLAYAPLDSAALAPGTVRVASNRQTIQHLEGGIIEGIYVKEGDVVEAGQLIVKLDKTQAKATLKLLQGRMNSTLAMRARLAAERDGISKIVFPESLLSQTDDVTIQDILKGQRNIFMARQKSLDGQFAILDQRVAQAHEQISGLEGQIQSEKRQLSLLSEEIKDVQTLLDQGLARKPRFLALKRNAEQIQGSLGKNRSQIALVNQKILELNLRMNELDSKSLKEIIQELRKGQAQISDLQERLYAATDVLKRIDIVAPITGRVVDLKVHTKGGVISPGATLMDIVPTFDDWIIDAKVALTDIDVVHVGLPTKIRFTAYNQRNLSPVDGVVSSISADRFTDDNSRQSYYLAQVKISDPKAYENQGMPLISGMQADVMIVTGERTALEYLLAPVVRSFNRSFRED